MTAAMTEDEITRVAKARVGFRVHLLVYIAVNLFLIAIWYVTTQTTFGGATPTADESFWPIWPEMGWGVGLLIHGFVVYGGGVNWQRREEERLRQKMGGH